MPQVRFESGEIEALRKGMTRLHDAAFAARSLERSEGIWVSGERHRRACEGHLTAGERHSHHVADVVHQPWPSFRQDLRDPRVAVRQYGCQRYPFSA
jgi:hypothetical protein